MAKSETTEATTQGAFWDVDDAEAGEIEKELLGQGESDAAEPPAEGEPPAEEVPTEEPKPEPEAPAAETKPEPEQKAAEPREETEKKPKGEGYAWRRLRQLEREMREREAREAKEREAREAAERAKAAEIKEPAEEELLDPIEKAQRDAAEARRLAEEAKQRAEEAERRANERLQQESLINQIVREEAEFKAKHPDYEQALKFLADSRIEEFDLMGKLDADAELWLDKHPDVVERHAVESGRNPEDYADIKAAARDIVTRIAIEQEKQALIAYARRQNRSVPQVAYELAKKRGFVAPQPEAPPAPTAKEKVQKAKEAEERRKPFTQNLSAVHTRQSPAPKPVTKRSELLAMDDADLDKLIEEMDAKNPSFFENLEDD